MGFSPRIKYIFVNKTFYIRAPERRARHQFIFYIYEISF